MLYLCSRFKTIYFMIKLNETPATGALGGVNGSESQSSQVMNNNVVLPDLPFIDKEEVAEDEAQNQPPAMPTELPPLVELLLSCTPDIYKPAVACGIFPPLSVHLSDVHFRYVDNVDHEATLMCVLMAGSGSGKDCVNRPIRHIMQDIYARDAISRQIEKKWKQDYKKTAFNKPKPERPKNIIIQEVGADMTIPTLVQRLNDAAPYFLYTSLNEIEGFDQLKSGGQSQAFQIIKINFDPEIRWGQDRIGLDGVSEKVFVRFNWNASTTIDRGMNFFRKVVNDGPVSRINFCTIPQQPIGADLIPYGIYPEDFAEQLRPYLKNLTDAKGLILIPEATQLAWQLVKYNHREASLSQSEVYDDLSKRAAVIAWLKACLLYVAQGNQWDERIEEFCWWSMKYDMWCKMTFFGQLYEQARKQSVFTPYRPGNMLSFLNDIFTREDLKQVYASRGKQANNKQISKMLTTWAQRNYIERLPDGRFRKVLA